MREKFRRFMIGRYGNDGLNQFLSIGSLVLFLLALITRFRLFYTLGLAALIWCYFRAFSRNLSKRTEENYRFYTLKDKVLSRFSSLRTRWEGRKEYRYYRCPQCRQNLRVPRGRGKIEICCPRCSTRFIKRS